MPGVSFLAFFVRPFLPPFKTGAYIYHKGGALKFGKLIMEDADLEIVGNQTKGFFCFFLREYKKTVDSWGIL